MEPILFAGLKSRCIVRGTNIPIAMPENNYDVFLSYHWRDHAYVEGIARALRDRNLHVFLDRWYLHPGRPWTQELETVMRGCRAVAVCIGPGE